MNENGFIKECQYAKDDFIFDKLTLSYSSIYLAIHSDGLISIILNLEIPIIKKYLTWLMGEGKLNTFTLLLVKHEAFNNSKFDEIIVDFIHSKQKKAISTSARASFIVYTFRHDILMKWILK